MRLCLVHWQRRRGGRTAAAAAPIVLVVRGGACHGGSWLLGGLPTAAVRLVEMAIEELQGDLGVQEGGKISVEMGDCSVPVTVAAVNVEYMRSAVERLERCQQVLCSLQCSGC